MESKKQYQTKPSLPKDLIFAEILPRISSVKSLLRFKCVSKSWCSFISTKKFALTQLQQKVKNTSFAQYSIISVTPTSDEGDHYVMKQCPISSCFSQQPVSSPIDAAQLEFDYPMTNYRSNIVGSCNGIFCIDIDNEYFVLWNPTTRKSHRLPPILDDYLWNYLDGFGYDEFNDDYKLIVRMTVLPKHRRGCCSFDYVFRLYSLKTNSWKTVDDFHGTGPFKGHGVLVNSKLHWAISGFIRSSSSSEIGLKIVSYDLGSETTGWVEQPSSVNGRCLSTEMSGINGCLCVLCNTENGMNVWLMKEYGVKESWCKVVNVPYFLLLHISEEGEVLGADGSTLGIYNPETDSIRTQEINNISMLHQSGFYFESLVSPCPDG